ncbi:oligopeptide-binding protein AppA precursor [bacterium BMS3Abin03]|nr:oligopeptide-binding protein AppA precursor [bacterium BMS3Abin03]
MRTKKLLPFFFIVFFLLSCSTNKVSTDRIVIGIPADVNTFNPLFAFTVDEGSITELLYLSLADFRWNDEKGGLDAFPMLAKKWEWADDSSFVIFYLRDDVKWSDGEPLTAEDVIFSLDLYSDPNVQSRLYGFFEDLYTDEENHIDVKKTFDLKSPYVLQINFKPGSYPRLIDIVHPVIPKHIFEKLERNNLSTADANFNPVTNGPFVVKKWERSQFITLSANKNSFLYNPDNVQELVFKVIPDYTSRLTQLKKGEIDLMELISTEDVSSLKNNDNIVLKTIDGREYDYVGWNNIDPLVYSQGGGITPNKLFGSRNVRIALTHAINRKEILEEYLYNYGELAVGPVSSIFKSYYDSEIKPYEYNPGKARTMLEREGWKDSDNNGVIDKNGIEFSFKLTYPSGNPLREYAATIMRNNLNAVGIDMTPESLELGAFIDMLSSKSLDAWMIAWYIPIPLELKAYWYSDLQNTHLNFVSYQNKEADAVMDELDKNLPDKQRKKLYYKFQKIIHEDEPVTFMYWIADIVGINKRVENINITPLGAITHCWEWSLKK